MWIYHFLEAAGGGRKGRISMDLDLVWIFIFQVELGELGGLL